MWVYHSPIGPIYIKHFDDGFGIIIDDIVYGGYSSAVAAADDVFTFSTGCYEWDSLCGDEPDCPNDLSEWERC